MHYRLEKDDDGTEQVHARVTLVNDDRRRTTLGGMIEGLQSTSGCFMENEDELLKHEQVNNLRYRDAGVYTA